MTKIDSIYLKIRRYFSTFINRINNLLPAIIKRFVPKKIKGLLYNSLLPKESLQLINDTITTNESSAIVEGNNRLVILNDRQAIFNMYNFNNLFESYFRHFKIQEEVIGKCKLNFKSKTVIKNVNKTVKEVRGEWICGLHPSSSNWFHFLTEVLPMLISLDKKNKANKFGLLLDSDIPNSALELLDICFPQKRKMFLKPGYAYKIEKLIVDTNVQNSHQLAWPRGKQNLKEVFEFSKESLLMAQKIILNAYSEFRFDTKNEGRKLFVIRESKFRKLTNVKEIAIFLEKMGFQIYIPNPSNILNQIKAFRTADLIVSQSGAALANIMFMTPGSRVIVLSSDTSFNNDDFFKDYGRIFGIKVEVLRGVPLLQKKSVSWESGSEFHMINMDFRIDVEKLRALV